METLLCGLGEKKKKCLGLLSPPDKVAVRTLKKVEVPLDFRTHDREHVFRGQNNHDYFFHINTVLETEQLNSCYSAQA